MKVLFYCDTVFGYGGVERVLAELAKELTKRHDVTILTTDSRKNYAMYGYNQSEVKFDFIEYSQSSKKENFICKGYSFLYKRLLPHNRFTSWLYGKSFFLPSYRNKLVQKINDGHYDVVIGVHAYLALHLTSICHRIHAMTIGWMHNSFEAFFEKENPYLPDLKDFFRHRMRLLDGIVVLSQADAVRYEKELNLNATVIYNPLTVIPGKKGKLGYQKFLAVGRFAQGHKGFDILIKAFALFARNNSDWTLEIVGEGPEESMYRSLISEYGLENRIKLCPFTDYIQKHYSEASVYVLSSRWEGFGLVLVEAMSHGLPIIASRLPVTRELLEPREVALFFESENVEHLAEQMHYIVREADWNQMSCEAISYSKDFMIDNISKVWEDLLNG